MTSWMIPNVSLRPMIGPNGAFRDEDTGKQYIPVERFKALYKPYNKNQ